MSLRRLPLVVLLAIASGVIAGHADAAGPAMTLGVAEDAVRAPDLPTAEAKMAQLRLAGFTAVRVTTNWEPGLVAPTADELRELRNVETAADLNGVEVYVSVYNAGPANDPPRRDRAVAVRAVRGLGRPTACRASTRSSSATSRT